MATQGLFSQQVVNQKKFYLRLDLLNKTVDLLIIFFIFFFFYIFIFFSLFCCSIGYHKLYSTVWSSHRCCLHFNFICSHIDFSCPPKFPSQDATVTPQPIILKRAQQASDIIESVFLYLYKSEYLEYISILFDYIICNAS